MNTQNDRTNHVHFRNKAFSILALLLFFSSFSDNGLAQTSTTIAGLTVRVTDQRGAIVPKAAVTLYTRDNQVRIKTLTDEKGTYRFEQLALR